MSWPLIWTASAIGGAAFGWFVGPVPLDFAAQLLVFIAQAAINSEDA